jgi:hypothetical protein
MTHGPLAAGADLNSVDIDVGRWTRTTCGASSGC